jgi:hypothetical protein
MNSQGNAMSNIIISIFLIITEKIYKMLTKDEIMKKHEDNEPQD